VDDGLGLIAQSIPLCRIDHHRKVGLEETGIDPVAQELVPGEILDRHDRPARPIEGVAFKTGVDVRHRNRDRNGAKRFKEGVVDRLRPDAQTIEIDAAIRGALGLVDGVDMELDSGVEMSQQIDAELFRERSLHDLEAAIGACIDGGDGRTDPGVGFRHGAEIIGRRAILHVDDTAANRIDLLVGREDLRTADIVDPDDALALFVDEINKALKALRERQRLGEGGDRPQCFLCIGRTGHENKCQCGTGNGHSGEAPAKMMCVFHCFVLLWLHGF